MERWISGLGLLVLLGLAYAFSRDRKAVEPRTLVWGVGLQLLFATIILGRGVVSFAGMFALVFLLALYVFDEDARARSWPRFALPLAALVGTGAAVALFYALGGTAITTVLIWVLLLVLAIHFRLRDRHLGRFAFVALLVVGLGELWATGVDGQVAFKSLSDTVASFLALSNAGAEFLFGNLAQAEHFFVGEGSAWPGFGFQFAFTVLPTIIFFSAFMSVLYYLGIVQVVIAAMARFMRWSLRTSGSETMSCSANVFVGQTEAPFLIKPFLKEMTPSELNAVMTGGFATIAGGVLAGYIQMGVDPGHLIAASVMSAPAALVIAKLLYPETEESVTAGDIEVPDVDTADNVVEAAANGTTDGLKLALNVGAMLIAFIALIAFLDAVLGYFDGMIDGRLLGGELIAATGEYAGFFPGSTKTFFGTLLAPLAFVMGVPWTDAAAVGNLLGTKITLNEFVAYGFLAEHIANGDLQPRSLIIATYALCGFANFSSIGIQIGGLSALEPGLQPKLSKLAFRALAGGALASFTTATVAGMIL